MPRAGVADQPGHGWALRWGHRRCAAGTSATGTKRRHHVSAGHRPVSWAALRQAVVWQGLRDALGDLAAGGAAPLQVVDAGGGSGGFAVPLAELGHRVVVVDPSPDSLASLERGAEE